MKKLFTLFGLVLLLAAGCTESETEEVNSNKIDTTGMPPIEKPVEVKKPEKKEVVETTERVEIGLNTEDKSFLEFAEVIDLGVNFKTLKEKIPSIKGIRPEGNMDELAAQGLTETSITSQLMGKTASLEFNFKNDSLYSFYYLVSEQDTEKGDRLYKGIRTYYLEKWGEGKRIPVEEDNRYSKSYYWELGNNRYGVMTYNLNTGNISWGVQNTKP
ncbi:MAG TPA: hypothetical protein VIK89_15000 [Cytophagaceae bacterium]